MEETTNKDRADWARIAVRVYAEETGSDQEDLETNIADLLCDLRHLCDERGFDFGYCDDRGAEHYAEEVREHIEQAGFGPDGDRAVVIEDARLDYQQAQVPASTFNPDWDLLMIPPRD